MKNMYLNVICNGIEEVYKLINLNNLYNDVFVYKNAFEYLKTYITHEIGEDIDTDLYIKNAFSDGKCIVISFYKNKEDEGNTVYNWVWDIFDREKIDFSYVEEERWFDYRIFMEMMDYIGNDASKMNTKILDCFCLKINDMEDEVKSENEGENENNETDDYEIRDMGNFIRVEDNLIRKDLIRRVYRGQDKIVIILKDVEYINIRHENIEEGDLSILFDRICEILRN